MDCTSAIGSPSMDKITSQIDENAIWQWGFNFLPKGEPPKLILKAVSHTKSQDIFFT